MTYLKRFLSPVLFASCLLASSAAHADAILTGTSVNSDTYSLDFQIDPDATPGLFDITGVSGITTINGVTQPVATLISTSAPGVITLSPSGYFTLNNILYPTGNAFDAAGVAFTLADGTEVNLFYNDNTAGSGLLYENNGYNSVIVGNSLSFSPDPNATTVTPEPSSLILLGTGILGAAAAARRRFQST